MSTNKQNLPILRLVSRAAMMLLLCVMTMTVQTAWAENVQTYYIDENGTRHDVTATVVTTYMDYLGTDGETTWYVVNENIFLYGSNNQTYIHGNVNLILADGCELQSAACSNGPNDGFRGSGNLTLYGQTAGTGTLSCGQEGFMNITGDFTVCSGIVSVSGNRYNAIRAANFTMRGGSVSITNNTNNDCGIGATGTVNIYSGSVEAEGSIGIAAGTVNIYGGSVTARSNGGNAEESNYGRAIQCSSTFNFYGGNVTAQSDLNLLEDQTRYGIYANGINLSWTSTADWINSINDGNLDNVICYFFGSGGLTIAPYKPFTDGNNTYTGTFSGEQVETFAGVTLLQPNVPAFADSGDGTPEHPYTIYNATGWGQFCNTLQDESYNHFSGKTVKLGANISITQSAGSAGHEFMGTFDGDGKTLTVDITETTTQGTAPFREINGATIRNLVVTGSVNGTIHAAGLVGFARGDASIVNTITNCKVATNVTVTTPSGNNYHCGGVVGHAFNCTLNMSNTVYCGDITSSGNNYVGGLQGWSDGNTINFSHCLFAGSYSGTASFHPVAVRNNNNATTASVSHVYYTVTPTLTNSSFIAADGTKATGRTTAPATIGDQTQSLNFMSTTIYQNGIFYNGLYYVAPTLNTDNSGAYLISSVDDWTNFCDMLYDNGTYNRFIGQTVKLGANISVTQSAGSPNHDFCGTFDGQNNTLTFTATATDDYCAPFRYVSGTSEANHAVIQNLDVVTNITATDFRHAAGLIADMSSYVDVTNCNVTANITATKGQQTNLYPAGLVSQSNNTGTLTVSGCTVSGTIATDGKYAAGMVGIVQKSASITNSVSSVTINSSTNGDGTHGGFVASLVSDRQLTIEGCVFNGKIVTTNGLTTKCGGFLGHNNTGDSTGATITNCLYAPTTDPNTVSTDCATFGRNVNSDLISNCYYTTALGDAQDAQGTQAYSITAGNYVTTLANAGTVSNNYTTSGLTFYNVGLSLTQPLPEGEEEVALYAAASDVVSLTLGNTVPEGYFLGYSARPTEATLSGSGNPYTLTMPDADVVITANTNFPSVSYIDENGETQQCTNYIWLTGTETTLGVAGQETWYVADGTLNYGQTITISGNVHLILKDNAVMNVGTEETPINGHGISCDNSSISIYAQSMGESQGKLHLNTNVESSSDHYGILAQNSGSITINGGEVEATGKTGIYANNDATVNINRGKVTANGTSYYGIFARDNSITINGGQVTANGGLRGIFANSGSVTINGGQVTAHGNIFGIHAYRGGSVTINGGQVTANGQIGIYASDGNITLGWSHASDFIFASSYDEDFGRITIANNKAFITEDGNIYTSDSFDSEQLADIAGKTLYPYIEGSVVYLDENGQRQMRLQGDYNTLSGDEPALGTTGQETWYVADGTLNYGQTITISGDVHLILKDNAVMNVGTEESPINGHGIYDIGHSFSIYVQSTGESQGQLHVIASHFDSSDACGIYAENSSITINGGKVEAIGARGIYAENSSVNINSGKVTAFGSNGCGIIVENGSITINGGQMSANNIIALDGSITINGGQVTANDINANANGSSVTINGGQVTANSIVVYLGNITLGWSNATDFIFAGSYSVIEYGTLSIAEGKTFIDEDGNTYNSGTVNALDINGKTLHPYIEGSVPYIDENGQWQLCTEYTVLTGTETSLGTADQETWYVADGTLNYSQTLILSGDVHLILKDGAVMNVGTTENPVGDGYGITGEEYYSISIYAQSMGDSKGQLHVNAEYHGIYAKEVNICGGEVMTVSVNTNGIYARNGNITIYNGHVTSQGGGFHGILAIGDIIINGGQVTSTGRTYGIWSDGGNLTINGGQVTANGGTYGIYTRNGNLTLGWRNASDFIYANKYYVNNGILSIAEGKAFIDEDGNLYSGTVEMVNGAYPIYRKTLRPYSNSMLFLADDADNTAIISKFNSQPYNVTLAGRKLYKDGYWNTLCLPFNMTAEQVTAQLEPTELKELDTEHKWANVNGQWSVSEDGHVTGLDNGTLYLNFKDADAISAGVPYIIKWASGSNIEDPVFSGVTIDSDDPTAVAFTGGKFVGTYSYTQYTEEDKSILFLGEENKLYWPQPDLTSSPAKYPSIGAFRAYFEIPDGTTVRAFRLNFDDAGSADGSSASGIAVVPPATDADGDVRAPSWYTLDGKKLDKAPVRKGLYIHNGKKVVVK